MQTQQLALKDDVNFFNEDYREKSNKVNKLGEKEVPNMTNPAIHLELSHLKKHNYLNPIKKEESNNQLKHSISLDSMDRKNSKKMFQLELKKTIAKNVELISETKKFVKPRKEHGCKKKLEKFLDSSPVIVVMTIFTIFVLFGNDIQDVCLPRSVDIGWDITVCVMLACYATEIILSSIAKPDYLWSFFFWLDFISTISLLQDITFIFDYLLTGTSSLTPMELNSNLTFADNSIINQVSNDQAIGAIQKVTSASRATRVLRIIRIIRLIRIVKLYKNALIARAKFEKRRQERERLENFKKEMQHESINSSEINTYQKLETNNDDIIQMEQNLSPGSKIQGNIDEVALVKTKSQLKDSKSNTKDEHKDTNSSSSKSKRQRKRPTRLSKTFVEKLDVENITTESRISKILTESITKKVIILIMCMLIIIPIISDDFYADDSLTSYTILAKYISNYWYINGKDFFDFKSIYTPPNMLIGKFLNNSVDENFPVISIEIEGKLLYLNSSWGNYSFRSSQVKKLLSSDGLTQIKYSAIYETRLTAGLNIGRTLFVCLLLGLASMYFEKDTKELVLEPLEVMIEIVDFVAKDPINAKNVENLRKGVKSTMRKMENKKNDPKKISEEKYEIKVIEGAIIKISALLAIGFGEAGGDIIKENLKSGNELNPMLKGRRRTAIFGFCDIRNFAQVNELLQQGTMVFVNQIAEIVHSCVDKFGGAANKNIGDAFLMIWKFKSQYCSNDSLDPKKLTSDNLFEEDPASPLINLTADMSVFGFLSIIIRINKDLRILAYRNNPKINLKLKNYKVRMGFGLHMGWAIEGAIGSYYKIDASYLSPNVNMAARLEAATKIYGVNILISGILYNLLTNDLKNIFRLVDRVTVKGSKEPIELYTVDLNLNLTPQKDKSKKKLTEKMRRERYNYKKLKVLDDYKLYGSITKTILNKKSFKELLNTKRGKEFYHIWEDALKMYFKGSWEEAGAKFIDCLKICESDGPSKTLLGYLKSNNFKAPDNWIGVRELTSKT